MIISLNDADYIPIVRVTMDTPRRKQIIVRIGSGKVYQFKQCDEYIYYFDTAEQEGFDGVMNTFLGFCQIKSYKIYHKIVITIANQLLATICYIPPNKGK